jgi:hypothetical protein
MSKYGKASQRVLTAVAGWLRRLWTLHRRLLRQNAAYAAAVAAGAAAIVSQDGLLDSLAAVGATLLAAYAALRRPSVTF